MKKLLAMTIVCALGAAVAEGTLIDGFDGDLSNYTSTVILDANAGGSNTAAWQIGGGALQLHTSVYDGIEQYAFIYNGLSLGVGEEIQMDLTHSGASQDLGLYVGGTTPVTGTRQDYVAVYARDNGQIFSRGFDGLSEFGLAGGSTPAYTQLFIARTHVNTYEAGYYAGGGRNIITIRTPVTPNVGTVVGFYADVRGTGVLGAADNLTLLTAEMPEPSTLALAGLCFVGLMVRRARMRRA